MTDIDEDELARQIERDVSDKGSLVALIACLLTVASLVAAGIGALLNAG